MNEDEATNDESDLRPSLTHVFDVEAEVEDPIEIGETGDGRRRIVPIVGGRISGRVQGEILPGGADYQLFRIDRPTELVAKYAFETDDGARVYVENQGMRVASRDTKERLRDGRPVDPEDVYFQSVPEFETADPDLRWLTERVFVASGARQPNGVKLAVYQVG